MNKIEFINIKNEEEFNIYLKEQFFKNYKKKLKRIRRKISSYKDYFKIESYSFSFDENKMNREYQKMLKKMNLNYTLNGIRILYPLQEFWNDIKDYIPKTIEILEVPFCLIKDDLSFLNNFSNLKTLVVNEFLSKEDLMLIYEKTNIRDIQTNSLIEYREFYKEEDFAIAKLNKCTSFVIYDDLIIRKKDTYKSKRSFYDKLFNKNIIQEEIEKDTIYDISINSYDLDNNKIKRLFKLCENININKLVIDIYSSDYWDNDFSFLEELDSKFNLSLKYGGYEKVTLEEFKSLVYSINWYKEIINESDLSPVEKVMFAFDIVKSFKYKDNLENKSDSREVHKIIETGNIVCVGYCRLLKLILNNLDDNIKCGSLDISCLDEDTMSCFGHERSIVKIDDDKYNIHGIYTLDATWDSVSDEVEKIVGNNYTGLDLYRYFLIPVCDYVNTFPNDSIPEIFMLYLDNFNESNKKNTLFREYNYIFNNNYKINDSDKIISEDEIRRYLDIKRISLEKFNDILYNVRIAEGYTMEEAIKEIEKVNVINKIMITIENNIGHDIEFFRENKVLKRKI